MTRNIDSSEDLPAPIVLAVQEFDGWSDEHFRKLDIHNSVNAPLYHYTDAAGLEGIIKNQEIWFTSHACLNDPSEIEFGIKIAIDILKEIGEGSDPRIKVFCELTSDLFTKENLTKSFGFYIACFSQVGDDLGQWRGYGANGRGFSLGFAQHLFQVTPTRDEALPAQFVTPVVYGKAAGRQQHFPAICEAVKIVGKAIEQAGETMRKRSVWLPFLRCMAESLIVQLIFNSLVIKHEAYQNEKEVRLIILGEHEKLKGHISTRARQGEIVPFIKTPFPLQAEGSIFEIVVGPSALENAENGVRALVRQFYKAPDSITRRSSIPYRAG